MIARISALRLLPALAFSALVACGGSPTPPPQVFAPLTYNYLPPIVLNVATISIENNYVPDAGAAALIANDPAPPANALIAMAQHRLVAGGMPGTGTFSVETASIEQVGDQYVGTMAVRLDVSSADGKKTGFTEATVTVTQTAPGSDAGQDQVQAALYQVTKQLMDAMNVQLQYQIQHNLGSWISYAPAGTSGALAAPGGIQATPLAAPGSGAPAAPASGGVLPAGSRSLGTLAPAPAAR